SGEKRRAGGLFAVQGAALKKIAKAERGDLVAIGKVEQAVAGQALSLNGKALAASIDGHTRPPLYALAVAATRRQDEVRVSGALAKLVEDDPGLALAQDAEGRQILLSGQGDGHVRLALERLKRRFAVDIETATPRTLYRETITKGT